MEQAETLLKRVKITKVQGRTETMFPVETTREGWMFGPPRVGQRFRLLLDGGRVYQTGLITEVRSDDFETENSTYELTELGPPHEDNHAELESTVDLTCIPRQVTIRCVDGSTIEGSVNLKHERRISDVFIKEGDSFIVVFDAVVKGVKKGVFVVNKQSIAWVSCED